MPAPDLFDVETAVLRGAKAVLADPLADQALQRRSLGELIVHYERLLRDTRRLIGHSDRAEGEMNKRNRALSALAGQLEFRATHDSLTGALNRGAVIMEAERCLARSDTALIVIDIDHFKRINDDFGHPTGDAVIRSVVACLTRLVGSDGAVGRIGGEEFSVVLPERSFEDACWFAHILRSAIMQLEFGGVVHRPVTVSLGVSWNRPGTSFETAYGLADGALYEAKRSGRNRVVARVACELAA